MIIDPPDVDELPLAPNPQDVPTFRPRAYPWSLGLVTFRTQLIALADNVHNNATEAATVGTGVAAAVGDAEDARDAAIAAATSAGGSASAATTQAGVATTQAAAAAADAATSVAQAAIATTKAAEAAASAASIAAGPVASVNGSTGTVVLDAADVGAQETLVSGTNIKTVGGTSLLGSGNIALLTDAPSDTQMYGRKDGSWQEVIPASGYSVGDYIVTPRTLTAPTWLLADSSTYLQSSYAALYAELGLLLNSIGQSKFPDPAVLPTGMGEACSWDESGTFLAVGHASTPFVTVYKRSGTTLTKLPDPSTLPPSVGTAVSWDPTGVFLAVSHTSHPYITIYQRSGTTLTKLADPATLPPGGARTCAFDGTGGFLAVGHGGGAYITVYRRSGTTFTKLANPGTLPPSEVTSCSWDNSGTRLAVSSDTTLTVYERSGTTLTAFTAPSVPGGSIGGLSWTPDGSYLTVVSSDAPYLYMYARSGTTLSLLPVPMEPPTSNPNTCAWDSTGLHLAVGGGGFINVYKRSGKRLSPIPASFVSPPAGSARSISWSGGGEYVTGAGNVTSVVHTWRNRNYDVSTHFAVPDVPAEVGVDTYIRAQP